MRELQQIVRAATPYMNLMLLALLLVTWMSSVHVVHVVT